MASLGEATLASGFDPSGLKRDMKKARSDTDRFLRGWTGTFRRAFSTGLGFIGAQVFGGIVRGLKNIAAAGFNIVTSFEQTGVAFRTMVGNAGVAMGLLRDLAEFAATTPFQLHEVENGARQLLAMGSSVREILPELRMLGDVSAGLNVPMERLVHNYGQVRTQARLTGRELRDFNIAGVPLIAELSGMLGKTAAEIKKMVEEGKIGFRDVQQAFVNMTSEGGRFHDLMQQQSLTTAGRISNLKDRITILAREIGTPLLNGINRMISAFSRMFAIFGPGGSMFKGTQAVTAFASLVLEKLGSMAEQAVDRVDSMGETIADTFIRLAERALTWGVNVVGQFAVGMARGATQALTTVMNFISGLISWWMNPQSPPRFLPDIDEWGTSAFTEFLRGFTRADFSILTSVQGPVLRALRNIEDVARGELDPKDEGGPFRLAKQTTEAYASVSSGIANAIDLARSSGEVNVDILHQVAAATGRFGDEIAKALDFELRLAAATRATEQATAALTKAQGKRTAASEALREAQAELIFQQRFGTDLQTQDDAEYAVFLAEEKLRLAKEEEGAAQDAVTQAEDREKSLGKQLDAQGSLVDQLLDMEAMQIDPLSMLKDSAEELKDGIASIGDISESVFGELGEIAPLESNLDEALEQMKERISKKWREIIGSPDDPSSIAGQWHKFVNEDIPSLQQTWDGLMMGLKTSYDAFVAPWLTPILDKLFPDEEGGAGGKIGNVVGQLLILYGAVKLVSGVLGAAGKAGTLIGGVSTLFGAGGLLGPIAILGFAALGLALLASNEDFQEWVSGVNESYDTWKEDTNTAVDGVLESIGTFFVEDLLGTTRENLHAWIDEFNSSYETWKENTSTKTQEVVDVIVGFVGDMFSAGRDLVQGLWDGLKDAWSSLKEWWNGVVGDVLDVWDTITNSHSASKEAHKRGVWFGEGLLAGVEQMIPDLNRQIEGLANGLLSEFDGAAMSAEFRMNTMGRTGSLAPATAAPQGGDTLIFYVKDTEMRREIEEFLRDRDLRTRRVR